ncbi:hypothetical protein DCAR_0934051 [Daucus carota subsp. sativus]|uniref:Uncharacterized protein n=1 Tax=Daucus carota subsp. sativus TaxID=79200 RepID=A0A175YEL9_DAUCS|nr:hypothetical protein DCAR_0934051 [Daucus carota subsp. sativus]
MYFQLRAGVIRGLPPNISFTPQLSIPYSSDLTFGMNYFNNSVHVTTPNTMPHAYSAQNDLINGASPIFNNAGGVAVSNTSASRAGRPRGSRNKPRGEDSAPITVILKVPRGVDLIDWVVSYASSKKAHLTILCGSGNVLRADLSHMGSQAPPITFTEPLSLITMSGMFLFSGSKDGPLALFNVTLGRLSGDIVSGTAVSMITMDEVTLTATVFYNPEMLAVRATEEMAMESNYNLLSGRNLKWSVVLSFEPGTDVIKALVQFARYYSLNFSVLCCSGLVSEVDIGNSRSHPLSVDVLGNFQIISFSGTCNGRVANSLDDIQKSFVVSMVSQNNVLTNGTVVKSMKAASYVTVVALAKDA